MKRWCALLLCFLMLGVGPVPMLAGEPVRILFDGSELVGDVPPVLVNGRTLVPLRLIFDQFELGLGWDGETGTVTGQRGRFSLSLTIDSDRAIVDGREITLDAPARIIRGRTMVPLRFISETVGADVRWNGTDRSVIIRSGLWNHDEAEPLEPLELEQFLARSDGGIAINHARLPESILDYRYVHSAGGSYWTSEGASAHLEGTVRFDEPLPRSADGSYRMRDYENTLYIFYDENRELLGYGFRNEGSPEGLLEQPDLSGVITGESLLSALTVGETRMEDQRSVVDYKIDRELLPDGIRSFALVGVSGSTGPWNEFSIGQTIAGHQLDGRGLRVATEDGTFTAAQYPRSLISFWTEDRVLLGYMLLH